MAYLNEDASDRRKNIRYDAGYIFEAGRGWYGGMQETNRIYMYTYILYLDIYKQMCSLFFFRCVSTVITKLFPHSLKYSMTCDNAAMSYGLVSLLLPWLVLPAGAIYEHELHCLCLRVNYTAFM